jgi:hypothetical protein
VSAIRRLDAWAADRIPERSTPVSRAAGTTIVLALIVTALALAGTIEAAL